MNFSINAQEILQKYKDGNSNNILDQANIYQYKLEIVTIDAQTGKFPFILSRKEHGMNSFIELQTDQSTNNMDILSILFSETIISHIDNIVTAIVPGVGTFLLNQKGCVSFKQNSQILSHYDLIFKCQSQLYIESCNIKSLTLQVPKCKIVGPVTIKTFHIDQDVFNLFGLYVHTVQGCGTLINRALLQFDGTKEDPTQIHVSLINEKQTVKSKIIGTNLKIYYKIINNDTIDVEHISSTSEVINNGDMVLRTGTFNGKFINDGYIIVKDELIATQLGNDGDIDIKNKLIVDTCSNTGSIYVKDELISTHLVNSGSIDIKNKLIVDTCSNTKNITVNIIDITQQLTNSGVVTTKDLIGIGTFINTSSLILTGTQENPSMINIKEFHGDLNQSQPEMCSVNSVMIWKAVDWFKYTKEYILPLTTTQWTLEDMNCSQLIIHNHGTVNLKDTTIAHIVNHHYININNRVTITYLVNEGTIRSDLKQYLKILSGNSTGKIIGKDLVLEIDNKFTNDGECVIWDLVGNGLFTNNNHIQFTGSQQNNSTVRIKNFENCGKITGFYIQINGLNTSFITSDTSIIIAKSISFTKTGYSKLDSIFELKGKINTNNLDINRTKTINYAIIETLSLKINGQKCVNNKMIHIGTSAVFNVKGFTNNKEFVIDDGTFTQRVKGNSKGSCNNNGTWSQHGDISIENATLDNGSSGILTWKNGKINIKHIYTNYGTWSLDNITSVGQLAIDTCGVLYLKNSTLNFSTLQNDQDIIISSGKYTTFRFENRSTVTFIDNNWLLSSSPPHGRYPNYLQFTACLDLGNIECEKHLTIISHLNPKSIKCKEVVRTYETTYNKQALIEQLQIQTEYLITSCPGFITAQNYQFSNIKSLDLYVIGNFNLNHVLTAETIKLVINGSFVFNNMATLAATNGSLTVKANNIDASYGKIYGKGPTRLIAHVGDVKCGFYTTKSPDSSKMIGCTYEYTTVVGNKWAYTTVYDVNGAYIASDSTLEINGKNLDFNFGQISSQGNGVFIAKENISAVRSIIQGRGTSHWNAKTINVSRNGEVYIQIGWMSVKYTDEWGWAATSDESILHFGKSIWFNTEKLTLTASTISSLDKIYIRHNNIDIDLIKDTKPSSFSMNSQARKFYCHSPKLISGQNIEIVTGDFTISGSLNSPEITIQAMKQFGNGSGTFYNPNKFRSTVNEPIIIDLTESIQHLANNPGLYQKLTNGEVVTEFPLGNASQRKQNQIMYLNDNNQSQLINQHQNAFNIINPLQTLNLDYFIQMALVSNAHKVTVDSCYDNIMHNSGKWIQQHKKNTIEKEELKIVTGTLLLLKLQEVAGKITENLKLVIGTDDINAYQSNGDISGNKFLCHTDSDQTHYNNRIVMNDDLTMTSGGSIKRETQTYETISGDKYTTIHKINAMPQQQFICVNGNVKEIADHDIIDIGTDTQAGENVIKEATNIIEQTLILPTTVTTVDENDDLFSSSEKITSNTTHDFLQTTVKAGKKGVFKAKNNIVLTGSQHIAQELEYWGLNYNNSSIIVADIHSETTEDSSTFSNQSTSLYQESPAAAFSVAMAKQIKIMCKNISVEGVTFEAETLIDGSQKGGIYGPIIKQITYKQQINVDTPLSAVCAGQEGSQEVEIKTSFNVKKIINQSENEMIFTNVELNKQITEIVGNYQEKFYELKKWQRSWCKQTQVVPDGALIVISIAVVILTKGMGAGIVNGMVGTTLSGTQIVMANVAFSSLAAKITTSLLKTGDPIICVKEVLSTENLLNLAITVASAGIADKVGNICDVNMASGNKSFMEHLQEHTIKNVSKAVVGTITGQSIDVTKIVVNTVSDAVSAKAANNRGEYQKEANVNPLLHGLGHAIDTFGIGYISAKLTNEANPIHIARDKAIGALIAESTAGFLDEKDLEKTANISRVTAGALGALLGFNVDNVDYGATNALYNNFLTTTDDEEEPETPIYLPESKQIDTKNVLLHWNDDGYKVYDLTGTTVEEIMLNLHYEKHPGMREHHERWNNYWKNPDYLNLTSYLPIPFVGSTATIICEGRDIYKGIKTFDESICDLGMGFIGGKIFSSVGNGIIKGVKHMGNRVYKAFVDNPNVGYWYKGQHNGAYLLNKSSKADNTFIKNLNIDEKAPYFVLGHGNEYFGLLQDSVRNVDVNHRILAKLIQKNGYNGQPIMLGMCEIGKKNFAQNLANKLGVPVQAPNGIFTIAPNFGHFRVHTTMNSYNDGVIKTFHPGNSLKINTIKPSKQNIPIAANTKSMNIIYEDLSKYTQRLKGGDRRNPKTGWIISKDTAKHGGSYWKLKDQFGNRKKSLTQDGKHLRT